MSNKKRWRYGDTNPVVAAVNSATVIEIGDLLWQDVDDAKPALALEYNLDLGTGRLGSGSGLTSTELQEQFVKRFLGVAMEETRDGDTVPIPVATTSVFEFDCLLRCWELGDLVGVLTNDTGRLQNQVVIEVADKKLAIGRVAKREASAANSVWVAICSTVMTGGVVGR